MNADISVEGIYFVLDVISWFESLGLDISSQTQPSIQTFSARTVSDTVSSIATVPIKGQVDIVFVVDTTGSMSEYISNVKNNITAFVNEIEDAGYKVDNNYGIKSMSEMIDLLVDDKINVSVVSNSSYQSTYKPLYEITGGVFANVGSNFKDELLSIADMINEETNSGCWFALNGLIPQIVKLDEEPKIDGVADTDKDGLTDIQELKSVTPTKYMNFSDYLYTKEITWNKGDRLSEEFIL